MTIAAAQYAGARGVAVKILNRVDRTDAYLDKLLDAELRSDEISEADKGLLAEIVHGVLRWRGRLDWVLNGFTHGNFAKSEVNLKNAMRIGLYQIFFLNGVPHYAAVSEAVEFSKRLCGDRAGNMVNAVLRNIIRTLGGIHYPHVENDPLPYLAVYQSHPLWMVKRWAARFGQEELERLLQANNEIPPLTLRINKLKITPPEFLAILDREGIQYQGSTLIDYFLRVKSLSGISRMTIFQAGYFSIQDESAALPVILLDPRPGDSVIDLCAAPGGKTTFIAELTGGTATITAVEKFDTKRALIQRSCERLGIANVQVLTGDARTVELPPADRVLADVPCSGLGTIRKKPDIKWKREPEDIVRLAVLQREILENASRLVKPGGILVYSTCTTEPEENGALIDAFLAGHGDFAIEPAPQSVNRALVTERGWIETWPHKHHVDGSFAVRMRRKSP